MEILGNQTFNATLALLGFVVMMVGRSMLNRDATVVADWDRAVGTVVDRSHKVLDGADVYTITVGFSDRPDHAMKVNFIDYQANDEGDEIALAVSPRNPRKLIQLDEHRTVSQLVFGVGAGAVFIGVFSFVMVVLFL